LKLIVWNRLHIADDIRLSSIADYSVVSVTHN
jgi:hypothetical protein